MKQFKGIVVDADQLSQEICHGKGEKCLDFVTGNIVLAKDLSAEDIGEGRAALHKGRRYIRIPTFDEMHQELKARYDKRDESNKENDESSQSQDSEYADFCAAVNSDIASEDTGVRWIANLKPTVMIGWSEHGIGVTRVYDPASGCWTDAR